MYPGADAVLSLYFYFGNHYHIGWIYHSFHINHSGYRGPGPFDRTGALFSVILVLTVLPALLVLFDRIITSNEWDRLQKYLKRRHESAKP